MIIQSTGVILRIDKFQEKGLIIRCFTEGYGKLSGFARVPSKKFGSDLIPGNICNIKWHARLQEHLGSIKIEVIKNIFCNVVDAFSSNVLTYITSMIDNNFKESVQSQELYNIIFEILNCLGSTCNIKMLSMIFNFELKLLEELGYRLDLSECAITKTQKVDDLYYISPKTGAACIKEAGMAYHDKLFIIPQFFIEGNLRTEEINDVGSILEHFMIKHEMLPESLQKVRWRLLAVPVDSYFTASN